MKGDGKGTGGTESGAGKTSSRDECYRACVEKKKTNSAINGATFGVLTSSRKQECYCETNMEYSDGNDKWESIIIPEIGK